MTQKDKIHTIEDETYPYKSLEMLFFFFDDSKIDHEYYSIHARLHAQN